MRSRCSDPNNRVSKHYMGRGISVCPRWTKFENFIEDMGPKPDRHSIERIDNDKGYSPENCVWLPQERQQRNRTNTFRITYLGKMLPLSEVAEITGIAYHTLYARCIRWPEARWFDPVH